MFSFSRMFIIFSTNQKINLNKKRKSKFLNKKNNNKIDSNNIFDIV
jgi:hypothetical protein